MAEGGVRGLRTGLWGSFALVHEKARNDHSDRCDGWMDGCDGWTDGWPQKDGWMFEPVYAQAQEQAPVLVPVRVLVRVQVLVLVLVQDCAGAAAVAAGAQLMAAQWWPA